jgi:glycosyltransferase involved in cell wall biosynthesis
VLETPPNSSWPNGFSPRWEAFIASTRARYPVELFAVHQPDFAWSPAEFTGSRLAGVPVTTEDAGPNPLNSPTAAGKLRRLRHYAFGRTPYMSHPATFPVIESRVKKSAPALVVSFLPATAQISRRLPRGVPLIAVLEEGYDRAVQSIAPAGGKLGWAARREAKMLRALYRELGEAGRTIVVISDAEAKWMAQYAPPGNIVCLPHAIDCRSFAPRESELKYDVAIVGDFSQARNYEPARRLFDAMRGSTELKWAFVGRNPHNSVAELAGPSVTVSGSVDDVRPWYAESRVIAVPTVAGAGIKTTVLQAWAMGKPVVATPFSATGLEFEDGREILLGNGERDMARQIQRLLADPALAASVGRNGREAVGMRHDIAVVAERFADLCTSVIERHSPA